MDINIVNYRVDHLTESVYFSKYLEAYQYADEIYNKNKEDKDISVYIKTLTNTIQIDELKNLSKEKYIEFINLQARIHNKLNGKG